MRDPRQRGKVCYPLEEILLLCLVAVLAGAETITDIAVFGVKKRDLLRRFCPFHDGTPTHDHLGDILAVLDAEQFQRCFAAWVAAITGIPEGVVAIDSLPPVLPLTESHILFHYRSNKPSLVHCSEPLAATPHGNWTGWCVITVPAAKAGHDPGGARQAARWVWIALPVSLTLQDGTEGLNCIDLRLRERD